MIKLSNIKIKPSDSDRVLLEKSVKKAGVNASDVKYFKLVKKSLDARNKKDIFFIFVIIAMPPFLLVQNVFPKVI